MDGSDLPLSGAFVVLLSGILVPAGDFLRRRLFPLHFSGKAARLGDLGFHFLALPGSLFSRCHEILLLK